MAARAWSQWRALGGDGGAAELPLLDVEGGEAEVRDSTPGGGGGGGGSGSGGGDGVHNPESVQGGGVKSTTGARAARRVQEDGTGLHSSTSQLNQSRFCQDIHPTHPPDTPQYPLNTH